MNWLIADDNGVIHSGNQTEIQLMWDLITRPIDDLAAEYRGTYTKEELENKLDEIDIDWDGDLTMLEVHHRYR